MTHARVQLEPVLVDQSEGLVVQIVDVRVLVVVVLQRDRSALREGHSHHAVLELDLRSDRKQFSRTHDDEALATHAHHVVNLTRLSLQRRSQVEVVERHGVAVEGEHVGVHASVVHHHRRIEAQLSDLRVRHLLRYRVDTDIAVDGDSGSRERIAIAINRHRHAHLQAIRPVPGGEFVRVELVLDGGLRVTEDPEDYRATESETEHTQNERHQNQNDAEVVAQRRAQIVILFI